jgi:tight adherence protein C
MIYLVMVLVGASVTLFTFGVYLVVSGGQGGVIRQRLAGLREAESRLETDERRRRLRRRESLEQLLQGLGERISRSEAKKSWLRRQLQQAGYQHPQAPAIFMALRLLAAVGCYFGASFLVTLFGVEAPLRFVFVFAVAALGWMIPFILMKRKRQARMRALQRGLADAVDLLVVCIEAGLGLNQALMRVAEEIEGVSPEIAHELDLVTLEMRAGRPREEALKNMAERTELDDVRSWVSMMVQTERFGTSIADSLRVHSDTMRVKRRQGAEEAAAKLTVKLLVPLVLFVLPAIFVVILGPGILIFAEFWATQ